MIHAGTVKDEGYSLIYELFYGTTLGATQYQGVRALLPTPMCLHLCLLRPWRARWLGADCCRLLWWPHTRPSPAEPVRHHQHRRQPRVRSRGNPHRILHAARPVKFPSFALACARQMTGDGLFVCPARGLARALQANRRRDAPIYVYRVDHAMSFGALFWGFEDAVCHEQSKVCHGTEIPFILSRTIQAVRAPAPCRCHPRRQCVKECMLAVCVCACA